MSLESSYDDAKNATLQKRVIAAIYKAAQSVAAESTTGKGEQEYLKRQNLAYKVKFQGEAMVSQWAMSICSGGIITNASTDNDIEFTVNSQWDAFSGVTDLDRVQP